MTHEEAWATGLFEGEGSIGLQNGKPQLQLKMTDRECVERFATAVGTPGQILGPYENRIDDGYPRKDFYVWRSQVYDAQRVFSLLAPLLSSNRLRRAAEVGLESQPTTRS